MEEILNNAAEKVEIISLLTGIIIIITGSIMYFSPPKKINFFYGYRTSASMKNQQVWDFSQKFSAVKMIQIGLWLLAASLLNVLFDISQKQSLYLGIGLIILGCIYMVIVTEKAIKRNFQKK